MLIHISVLAVCRRAWLPILHDQVQRYFQRQADMVPVVYQYPEYTDFMGKFCQLYQKDTRANRCLFASSLDLLLNCPTNTDRLSVHQSWTFAKIVSWSFQLSTKQGQKCRLTGPDIDQLDEVLGQNMPLCQEAFSAPSLQLPMSSSSAKTALSRWPFRLKKVACPRETSRPWTSLSLFLYLLTLPYL